MDGVVGDFLAYLEGRGLLNTALVVLTSDHGEGLGEHGESTHGYFLYENTLRVPLIVHWPQGWKRPPKDRVDEPGKSPRCHQQFWTLRAVRAGRYKYVDAPRPELYDQSGDPGESRYLYGTEQPRATAMRHRQLPDVVDIRISLGLIQQRSGRYAEAAEKFQRALERAPLNSQTHFDLALSQFRLHRSDEAIEELQAALATEPWYTRAEELLADNLFREKDYAQARVRLDHLLSVDPESYTAHYNLGVLAAMNRNWNEAQQELLSALHTDPTSAEAHSTLGSVYVQRGDLKLARSELQGAIRLQPELASPTTISHWFQKNNKRWTKPHASFAKRSRPIRAARAELDRMEGSTMR